ncbi:palmitoyl-protein thioesterase 1-like [Convolutriloba macropyga]|uniref:palmitoyl-protein thioesterase 1-like n=1 Tax=Convolutriloba macropyga TaxID=536237 RepID=UPI003F524241
MIRCLLQFLALVAISYSVVVSKAKHHPKRFEANETTPVVLWHGMGDICCNPLSMGSIKRQIERQVPGIYVYSIMVGDNIVEDFLHGFIMNVNKQVSFVCDKIQNDSKLANGYHAMGFSQGGQFLRAVAQRCPYPPIKNLITFGGQHQGVFGLPQCGPNNTFCDAARDLATDLLYLSPVQNISVQAEYWHDPRDPQKYEDDNIFIAEINNEKVQNNEYKENLLKLDTFVMVQFTEDTEVVPRESEWFGYYQDGQAQITVPLENTTLYTEDKLGLRQMDEEGRLVRYPIKGNHLQISREALDDIIDKYIK